MKPLWIVRKLGARVVAIKCCTVPCQRIRFARLYSGQTLCIFLNGQTKLVKECFNSQMFWLASQTKSFSTSKCINPWVDEVTCSTKNLVSSLNLLLYVLTKICLYLSFSLTLTFLKFIRCCYLQAISSCFNTSTHFHVENPTTQNHATIELLIGTLCCKTGWKVMLRVLSPTFKPVLQRIRFLEIALILTSDWIKSRGNHAMYGSYVTCCNRRLSWVGKTRQT